MLTLKEEVKNGTTFVILDALPFSYDYDSLPFEGHLLCHSYLHPTLSLFTEACSNIQKLTS